MSLRVHGIHHLTAITARAAQNLTFYTDVLGLRLVKKTVNQDDVRAYHLFYADNVGSPGTDLTFFRLARRQRTARQQQHYPHRFPRAERQCDVVGRVF